MTGAQRAFTYKAYGGEFVCSHEPGTIDASVDKEAVKALAQGAAGKIVSKEKAAATNGTKNQFPPLPDLVKYCQQLIDGKPIK